MWVNPRVSAAGFAPRAGGMAAALPHVDALVSGHSLEALGEVADAIAAERGSARLPAPAAPEPEADEPWASATPVAGQLGRDAERLRPEPRQDDPGMEPMTKTCIYPGCERPAVPPHPVGGPQPSFCDREDHNALTAHQERERRARAEPTDTDTRSPSHG